MLPLHPQMMAPETEEVEDPRPDDFFYPMLLAKTTRDGPVDILQDNSVQPSDSPYVQTIHIRPNEIHGCWSKILSTFRHTPVCMKVHLDEKGIKPVVADCVMRALDKRDKEGWIIFREAKETNFDQTIFNIRGMYELRDNNIAFILSDKPNACVVHPSVILKLQIWGTSQHMLDIIIDQPTFEVTMDKWLYSVASILQRRACLTSVETLDEDIQQKSNNMSKEGISKEVLGLPII